MGSKQRDPNLGSGLLKPPHEEELLGLENQSPSTLQSIHIMGGVGELAWPEKSEAEQNKEGVYKEKERQVITPEARSERELHEGALRTPSRV